MQYDSKFWPMTLVAATLAIAFATAGLLLDAFVPATASIVISGLLLASLASTATAFGRIALRVRRLELENEGLIEEISQEFDSVKDKIDIFAEALESPRTLSPEEETDVPVRRVMVK